MDSKLKRGLLVVLGIIVAIAVIFYMGNSNHEAKKNQRAVIEHATSESDVHENKTVIKKVYVTEEDFDEYDPYNGDITTSQASYWYILYESRFVRGYNVIEIDVPYPDIIKMVNKVKNGLKTDIEYVQISFFKRVPFETYRTYREGEDNL